MAAFCQARELAEVLSTLDGMWVGTSMDACREAPAYEVHVEHVIGLTVQLCTADERLVSVNAGYRRSLKLRDHSTT